MKKSALLLILAAGLAFAADKKPTLIFFMNPNGRPCQIQDQILLDAKKELEKAVVIQYVKTTVPEDRDIFYQYGIRSLPSIVLLNPEGKEAHRFPPGIQEVKTLMEVIRK